MFSSRVEWNWVLDLYYLSWGKFAGVLQQAGEEMRVFQETRLVSERHRRCSEGKCYNDTCARFALRLTPQAPERLKPEWNLKSGQEPIRPGRGEKENPPHSRSESLGFQEYLFKTDTFQKGWGSQSSFLFSGLDCLHAASTGCSLYIDLVNNTLIWTDNSQGSLHVGGLCAAQYFL